MCTNCVGKTSRFFSSLIILTLVVMLFPLVFDKTRVFAEGSTFPIVDSVGLFVPVMRKPAWVDQDNNGISDSLDQEIAERIVNGTSHTFVNVNVMLRSEPTVYHADDFVSHGGYITTFPWTRALYGFGGMIPYDQVADFVEQCSDVLLVEKEAVGRSSLAYATQQAGARGYVWNTMGFQGDPNSSIAIVDTGIDASHSDFSPGFGD